MTVKWLERKLLKGPNLTLILSLKEFTKALDDCFISNYEPAWIGENAIATLHYFNNYSKGFLCIVALNLKECVDGIDIACTLVHESVHIFQRWCEYLGEAEPSKEFEAYCIESIFENLMRECKRKIVIK